MCYIQTHIHARIQTLRQTGLRGAIVIIEKKRKKKKELKFVVLIFLGAGRRKILRTFICLGTLVGNETRGNRGVGPRRVTGGFFRKTRGFSSVLSVVSIIFFISSLV